MESTRRMNAKELAHKVQWEGGVLSALEYGIRSDEIADPELATLWRRMEQVYGQLRPSVELTERLLRTARRASGTTGSEVRVA